MIFSFCCQRFFFINILLPNQFCNTISFLKIFLATISFVTKCFFCPPNFLWSKLFYYNYFLSQYFLSPFFRHNNLVVKYFFFKKFLCNFCLFGSTFTKVTTVTTVISVIIVTSVTTVTYVTSVTTVTTFTTVT